MSSKWLAGLAGVLLAAATTPAFSQLAVNGTITVDESGSAEGVIDDTTGESSSVVEFGSGNVIDNIYINYDADGVLLSSAGKSGGNSLILYIDNGTTTGLISDFSSDSGRGYSGPWPRNIKVNNVYKPDFFLAAYYDGGTGTFSPQLHSLVGTTVTNIAGQALAASSRGGGGAYVSEAYIPYSVLYPGVGGPGVVPSGARIRVAAFFTGGDNYSSGDAAPGLDTNAAVSNFPSKAAPTAGFDGGTGVAEAAQLNVYREVIIDSDNNGVPNGFTGELQFSPSSINMIYDNSIVQVNFPKNVDQTSAETVGNYTITVPASGISIAQAKRGLTDSKKVYLKLSTTVPTGSTLTINSSNIASASNLSNLTPLTTLSTTGQLRLGFKFDANGTSDTLIAENRIFVKGSWDSYSGSYALRDVGPTNIFTDITYPTPFDTTAGDARYEGFVMINPPISATDYTYAIVGYADPAALGTTIGYSAGYFGGAYDRVINSSASGTVTTLTDTVENSLLLGPRTVKFTYRIPTSWATIGDLTAPGVVVRLQGGPTYGNEGLLYPMSSGDGNVGIPMTYVGTSGANTVWEASVNFITGTDHFDVGSYRLVISNLTGTGNHFYELGGLDTGNGPTLKDDTIHIHVFRVYNTDGTANDQDITLAVAPATNTTPTFDVPAPPPASLFVFTGAENWNMYE